MAEILSDSRIRRYVGKAIAGATDRQQRLAGFDQGVYSQSHVLCIGAGGLISHIAPTLVRKGIGALTILDDDVVEPSNLIVSVSMQRISGRIRLSLSHRILCRNVCMRQRLLPIPSCLKRPLIATLIYAVTWQSAAWTTTPLGLRQARISAVSRFLSFSRRLTLMPIMATCSSKNALARALDVSFPMRSIAEPMLVLRLRPSPTSYKQLER
jgi:ThiF family